MEAYTSFAYVYDTFMDNVPYGEWARHIREKLCEHGVTDGIVLDLGCGTGTMTERLAGYGYDMIGVDNSEEMLELAMEKKTESGYDILYLLQDMRGFELYGTVRAVVSVCDSVNYITEPDELEEVFRLVNNYLDPKGIFLFDFNTVHKYRDVIGDSTIAEDRGVCSFIWDNRYYEKEQINEYDLTLFIAEDFNPMENAYVSERTAEIRSEVVRHMCTTTNRITDKLGKVDWNAVKKVAIGITAVTVSGLVVAATGGLAAGAVLAALPAMGGLGTAMVSGAVIGAIGGASYSAVNSGLSGNSLKQVAKDTLVGGIAGAVTGGVMGGLSYGAGKLLNVVRSAGSTHNDGIDKSFKKLVAEVTETKLPEGTWEKPPLERGDIIDKAMGNNLGHNFPTIDKVENGVVTSVKSRDLGAKTYQNGNKLEKVIVKDINKVSGFIGETFNGKFVNAEEIVGRQLQVVVPNVTLSEAQINAVNNATKHGIDKGVKLIITVGK